MPCQYCSHPLQLSVDRRCPTHCVPATESKCDEAHGCAPPKAVAPGVEDGEAPTFCSSKKFYDPVEGIDRANRCIDCNFCVHNR